MAHNTLPPRVPTPPGLMDLDQEPYMSGALEPRAVQSMRDPIPPPPSNAISDELLDDIMMELSRKDQPKKGIKNATAPKKTTAFKDTIDQKNGKSGKSSTPVEVQYEGYDLRLAEPLKGQKLSWQRVKVEQLHFSDVRLKEMTDTFRQKTKRSAAFHFDRLTYHQQNVVNRLIRRRKAEEKNKNAEWSLISIQRTGEWHFRSLEVLRIRVIIRRQDRNRGKPNEVSAQLTKVAYNDDEIIDLSVPFEVKKPTKPLKKSQNEDLADFWNDSIDLLPPIPGTLPPLPETNRQEEPLQVAHRQEAYRREEPRHDASRQEAQRQEIQRQDTLRQEARREEAIREEVRREEALREELLREEAQRQEAHREEAHRQEANFPYPNQPAATSQYPPQHQHPPQQSSHAVANYPPLTYPMEQQQPLHPPGGFYPRPAAPYNGPMPLQPYNPQNSNYHPNPFGGELDSVLLPSLRHPDIRIRSRSRSRSRPRRITAPKRRDSAGTTPTTPNERLMRDIQDGIRDLPFEDSFWPNDDGEYEDVGIYEDFDDDFVSRASFSPPDSPRATHHRQRHPPPPPPPLYRRASSPARTSGHRHFHVPSTGTPRHRHNRHSSTSMIVDHGSDARRYYDEEDLLNDDYPGGSRGRSGSGGGGDHGARRPASRTAHAPPPPPLLRRLTTSTGGGVERGRRHRGNHNSHDDDDDDHEGDDDDEWSYIDSPASPGRQPQQHRRGSSRSRSRRRHQQQQQQPAFISYDDLFFDENDRSRRRRENPHVRREVEYVPMRSSDSGRRRA